MFDMNKCDIDFWSVIFRPIFRTFEDVKYNKSVQDSHLTNLCSDWCRRFVSLPKHAGILVKLQTHIASEPVSWSRVDEIEHFDTKKIALIIHSYVNKWRTKGKGRYCKVGKKGQGAFALRHEGQVKQTKGQQAGRTHIWHVTRSRPT